LEEQLMADFCTVADVGSFLQIEISDADKVSSCERAITAATNAIKNYCHQEIEFVADDEYTFDVWAPSFNLVLPEMPVISVASITEDGDVLTEGDDEDYVVANHGQLIRRGARWTDGPQKVVVVYTHGYETIPGDIVEVCTRAAARAYQAGLRSSDSDGVPGVASKSLGDYSVSYSSGAGGAGEGVMGASGSRMLLMSEKDMLDKYRDRSGG
jgi:hypothetical protein